MAFTNSEIGFIANAVGCKMAVRLTTKYGNIVLKHIDSKKVIFSIYKRDDGIIIRRRLGYSRFGNGNVLNGGKAFPTLKLAMVYFKNYMEKYPKSLK